MTDHKQNKIIFFKYFQKAKSINHVKRKLDLPPLKVIFTHQYKLPQQHIRLQN